MGGLCFLRHAEYSYIGGQLGRGLRLVPCLVYFLSLDLLPPHGFVAPGGGGWGVIVCLPYPLANRRGRYIEKEMW